MQFRVSCSKCTNNIPGSEQEKETGKRPIKSWQTIGINNFINTFGSQLSYHIYLSDRITFGCQLYYRVSDLSFRSVIDPMPFQALFFIPFQGRRGGLQGPVDLQQGSRKGG